MSPREPGKASHLRNTALVSIHDVTPSNLDSILGIMAYLKKAGVGRMTLLIVAGLAWRPRDIERLKRVQEARGVELAGHGWRHRIDGFGSLAHRLHGLVISRREAEHLSLSADDIANLVDRNFSWFRKVGLHPPDLYVPPAWAMGALSRKGMARLPFRYYETLIGVYDAYRRKTHPMGVCGYMADTRLRTWTLRATNAASRFLLPRPLRIAIHPDDLRLFLAGDLAACLQKEVTFSTYSAYFSRSSSC